MVAFLSFVLSNVLNARLQPLIALYLVMYFFTMAQKSVVTPLWCMAYTTRISYRQRRRSSSALSRLLGHGCMTTMSCSKNPIFSWWTSTTSGSYMWWWCGLEPHNSTTFVYPMKLVVVGASLFMALSRQSKTRILRYATTLSVQV